MDFVKIKDLYKIKKGKKIEQIDELVEGAIRCIQIDDLRNDDNIKYCIDNGKHVLINENDIVIAWDGANAGTIGYGLEGAIGSTLAVLTTSNKNFDTEYCGLFLKSKFKYLRDKCTGATIPHISRTALEELCIPNIDLQSQKKISKTIKSAQILIDKRKDQIELLDELVESKFIEMFGDVVSNPKEWNVVKLGKISSVGSSKRVFVEELVNDGIPFYRGTEIGALSTGEKIEPTLFITKEHYKKLKDSTGVPAIGDLLMPSICPDGRIWSVDTEMPFYFKDGRVLWIHLENSMIDSMFLKHMLREKFIRDYNKIASGTTFAELKIFALKDLEIIMPPIELQNQFADFAKQVDEMKLKMEKSLKELEDNLNSLMQSAFKGN